MRRLEPQRHSPGFVDKTPEKNLKTAGLGKLSQSMRIIVIHFATLLGLLLLAAVPGASALDIPEQGTPDVANTPTGDTAIDSAGSAQNAGSIAYERMLEFMEQGYYDLAAQAARQVLEQTREKFGDTSIEQVAALNNLARAQMLNGDLVDAETTYKQSIDLTERLEGILSPRLINAYIGLGATYNRAGLHDQSVEAFKRALRLNHVNEGFYNLEQFIILDGMTEAYLGLKEYENAHFYQSAQLEIAQRKFGEKDPRTVPTMFKLARWYERIGDNETARSYYQEAAQILRKAYGKNDIAVVDALLGIADTYRRQGLFSESVRLMKKSLEILEAAPEPDPTRIADVMVRLGDQYTNAGKPRSARGYYEDAWQRLSNDENRLALRDEYFGNPKRLTGVAISVLRLGPGIKADGPGLKDGYVLLGYSVTEKGRAKDVRVIESEPTGIVDKPLIRAFEHSTFRPRMEDGHPVPTEQLIYRHTFRYRPKPGSDPTEAGSDPGKTKSGKGRLPYPDRVTP